MKFWNLPIAVSLLLSGCNAQKRPPVRETETIPQTEAAPEAVAEPVNCPADPVFGGIQMKTAQVTFPEAKGMPSVVVEIAETDEERARGLMYRTHLPKNGGMLFLPDGPPHVQTFWMKNTCIALDMLFISENGVIVGILENVPPMNTAHRSVKRPSSYVLEVNAGWTSAVGVKTGQRVALPSGPGI